LAQYVFCSRLPVAVGEGGPTHEAQRSLRIDRRFDDLYFQVSFKNQHPAAG
jgi:hypothetical protein